MRRARVAKMEAGGGFSAESGGAAPVLSGIRTDGRARGGLLFLQMGTSVLLCGCLWRKAAALPRAPQDVDWTISHD